MVSVNGASAVSGGNDAQRGSYPVMSSGGLAGQPAFNLQNIMSGSKIGDLSNLGSAYPRRCCKPTETAICQCRHTNCKSTTELEFGQFSHSVVS